MEPRLNSGERAVVSLISLAHFCSHLFILTLPPLFPLMRQDFQVSYAALGGITAVFGIVSALTQYPLGVIVDRFGAKYILIPGLAIVSLCFCLMGFAPSIFWIYILAGLAGAADGVFHPCDYSILSKAVDKHRLGRAFAIHAFWGFAGFAVAPLVVVPIGLNWGWQSATLVLGIFGLISTLILFLNINRLSDDEKAEPAPSEKKQEAVPLSAIFMVPSILLMFGFYTFHAMANSGLTNHAISALIEKYGFSYASVSLILPSYLWGIIAGIFVGGLVAHKFSRLDITAAAGYTISAFTLFLIAIIGFPLTLIIATFFVTGFAVGFMTPSRDVLVRAVSPDRAVAQAFGFVNAGFGIGGAIGAVVVGWILDLGYQSGALIVPGIFMLLSMFFAVAASFYKGEVFTKATA